MKFRYYIVFLNGEEPAGTDDAQLAQQIADTEEQCWIIDTETGLTVEDHEDSLDICEIDAEDYEDPADAENEQEKEEDED